MIPRYKGGTFIAQFSQTFGSQSLVIIVNLISGIILSRYLGPEGRGIFVSVVLWANTLVCLLGLSLYQTAAYLMKVQAGRKHDVFMTLSVIGIVMGIMAAGVAEWAVIPQIIAGFGDQYIATAQIFFLGLILGPFNELILGALAAEEKFRYANFLRFLFPTASVLGMGGLLFIGQLTVIHVLYLNFSLTLISAIATIAYGYGQGLFNGQFRRQLILPILSYAIKIHGGTASSFASTNGAQIIMSTAMPPAVIGLYSTAQNAASPLQTFSNAISLISLPKLTGMSAELTHARTMQLWKASLLVLIILGIAGALMLPYLIPIVYGSSFKASVLPACILLLSMILNGQSVILANALSGSGKPFTFAKSELSGLVIVCAGLPFVLPLWGIIGAASLAVVASGIRLGIYLIEYNRHIHRLSLREFAVSFQDAATFIKRVKGEYTA